MRLISLRLRQWRCYEDCFIEFPDGLIGVRGPNGAGKSTIAEAIGWALFGKMRHRARVADLKRQGAPKGTRSSVELEFQLGAASYRVERFVSGDAKFWINDQLESTRNRDTNARIVQELDITWEVFERTVYAQQKDVAALDPSATGPQRKAHVERLLGLERYKRAAERARGEARVGATEVATMQAIAPDVQALDLELKDAEQRAADGDPAVEKARAAHEEATRLREEASKLRDHEQARQAQHALLAQQRATLTEGIEQLEEAAESRKALLAQRDLEATRLEEIRVDADRSAAAERAIVLWAELAEAAGAHDEAVRALAELGFDSEAGAEARKRLEASKAERTTLLMERPLADTRLTAARRRLAALQEVESAGAVEERRAAVSEGSAALVKARDAVTVTRQELEHDRAHVDEVKEGGPDTPCPVCRKPYGAEYDDILEGYTQRIASNEGLLVAAEAARDTLTAAFEVAEAALRDAERAALLLSETEGAKDVALAGSAVAEAEAELERVTRRLGEIEPEIVGLTTSVAAMDGAAESWRALEAARLSCQDRLQRALAALELEAYAEAAHREAELEGERLAALNREAQGLTEGLGDVRHLREQDRLETKRLGELEAERKENAAAIAELAFDPAGLENATQALAAADQTRDDAQAALAQAQLIAQSSSLEVLELRRRLEEGKAAHEAIAAKQVVVRQYEVVADILGRFRDEKARRAWPRLEQFASTLLSAATDGRYADIKLSEDYRLGIVDRGEEHELARFSGGEQDLANLCLRLAIADWVSKERDVDLGFVVLDEVFGSQDEERRQRLLGELRALGNRFRQMLVITHLPEIAELCDEQLLVSIDPESGVSTAVLV